MDFSFKLPEDRSGDRNAFRTRVPGLEIRIPGHGKLYPVTDVSAGGFALEDDGKPFSLGQKMACDLLIKGQPYLPGVNICVRRIIPDKLLVGCSFEGLDRRQEVRLDKLVLEVQKRLISMRKAKQEGERR